ncbi:hypothetical protein JCM8097_000790 [Rhodosporidiobolus ruineniae]
MAMTSAALPAPLRLRPAAVRSLSTKEAEQELSAFLASSIDLLGGSSVVRASLVRLTQGLRDAIDAAPVAPLQPTPAPTADEGDKTKKRRKSGVDGESKKKKRKTEA